MPSKTIAKHDNSKGKRDIVVAIVAGHGGEDPGSIGAAGTYEKRVTLKIICLSEIINEIINHLNIYFLTTK